MAAKINLLPKEELEKKAFGKVLKWMLSYGRYIVISVELVVLLVFFSRFIYDRRLADLNDAIEQKQAIVTAAQDLETTIRDFQEKLKKIKKLESERMIYLKLIETLKTISPKEVQYSDIAVNQEELTLTGQAISNVAFARLLTTLKNDENFSEIQIQALKKNKDTNMLEFTTSLALASR